MSFRIDLMSNSKSIIFWACSSVMRLLLKRCAAFLIPRFERRHHVGHVRKRVRDASSHRGRRAQCPESG
jgi:hypothetical protein